MNTDRLEYFSEDVLRKIRNLEKRMAWLRRDMEFLKAVYEVSQKKSYLPKKGKIEQLNFL